MLTTVTIENIAIIARAQISFGARFNVLTGETGAGKSIIIDAINAVLGERTSRDVIRTGADSAKVTALFTDISASVQAMLTELGLEPAEDGELLLQRTLQADGRNVCRINGATVSVAMLKTIGRSLLTIHGQHDSQALLNPEVHYQFVDSLAENEALLEQYRQSYAAWQSLRRELAGMQMDESEKERKLDMLEYQIQEIADAGVEVGERDALIAERDLQRNAQTVITQLQTAYALLQGDEDNPGVADGASDAASAMEAAAAYYQGMEAAAEAVREASYALSEYAAEVRNALDDFVYDPQQQQEIEARLDLLYQLSRKYGETEEDILAFYQDAVAQREAIVLSDERIVAMQKKIQTAKNEMMRLAKQLQKTRQQAGKRFAAQVKEELAFLDMPNVHFLVAQQEVNPGPDGIDDITFLISANVGEEPKPLAKIASGGELSRIMLAIKNVLAEQDRIGTLIFDEVDAGVSGRAAQKVALKLREVAQHRQVICVTHLAQIAAQAQQHFHISKAVADDKTYTKVERLDFSGRKRELARITGGLQVTQLQLEHAEEMLREAGVSAD